MSVGSTLIEPEFSISSAAETGWVADGCIHMLAGSTGFNWIRMDPVNPGLSDGWVDGPSVQVRSFETSPKQFDPSYLAVQAFDLVFGRLKFRQTSPFISLTLRILGPEPMERILRPTRCRVRPLRL